MCSQNEELCEALCRAIKALGNGIALVMMGEIAPRIATQIGIPMAREGYIDLNYNRHGQLVLERRKQAWEPEEVARRALELVLHGRIPTIDGETLQAEVETICIHGDAPNAPEIAQRVRQRLEEAGITVRPLGAGSALSG